MKKILLLCLALVLALGSLGVAGALWSDDLYIIGDVYTGDIGVEWSLYAWWDDEIPEKDVSFVEAYIMGDTLYVYIWNAYPSITYTVQWDLHGIGSVPVHFAEPVITGNLPANTDFTFTDLGGTLIEWSQVQLHQDGYLDGLLTVHLENDAEQLTSYWFQIDLVYGQYNEFPLS